MTALVVASALAFCAANDLAMPPETLAEQMAEAEHYVGTRGGGMDQAVCLLAAPGHALKIDFFPLRVAPVPFPPGCRIVAAHSTVRGNPPVEQAGCRAVDSPPKNRSPADSCAQTGHISAHGAYNG